MTGSLIGRTALVTGAAHNLGLEIALELAREGAAVVTHARTGEDAATAADLVAGHTGAITFPIAFDLGDRDKIAAGFAALDSAGWMADAVALCGAHLGLHDGSELEQPPAFFDDVLAVNVSGVHQCCMLAAKRLVDAGRPGGIAVISSLAGERAIRGRVAYNTSKAAVDGLVRSLAVELAPQGIRVNGVAPGYVWSDRWGDISEAEARERRALIPVGTETAQSEIARLTAFLLSDAAPTLTGERIVIDGGLAAQQSPPARVEVGRRAP